MKARALIIAFLSLLAVGCAAPGGKSTAVQSDIRAESDTDVPIVIEVGNSVFSANVNPDVNYTNPSINSSVGAPAIYTSDEDYKKSFADTPKKQLNSKDENVIAYTYSLNGLRHIEIFNKLSVADQLCTAIYKPKDMEMWVAIGAINEYYRTGSYGKYRNIRGTKVLIGRSFETLTGFDFKFLAQPGEYSLGYSCIIYNSDVIKSKENPSFNYVYVDGVRYVSYFNNELFDQSCNFQSSVSVIKRDVVVKGKQWSEAIPIQEGLPKVDCELNIYR